MRHNKNSIKHNFIILVVLEYTIIFFLAMIEVFWVKDPRNWPCYLETTVMNFLLPKKNVTERGQRETLR